MGTTTIKASTISKIYYSQGCLLCDNTRRLPEGMTYCTSPWVCDDCRDAIVFLKEFKKEYPKIREILDKM